MKRVNAVILGFGAACVAVAATLLFPGAQSQATPTPQRAPGVMPPVLVVKTVTTTAEQRVIPIHGSGRLASKSETRLAFKTGGLIERVLVDEGAKIVSGELLATLNMKEVDARVAQARSAHRMAEREYQRRKTLHARQLVPLSQLQDAESVMIGAASVLKVARFNRQHSEIRAPISGRVLRRLAEPNELLAGGEPVLVVASEREGWVVRTGVSDRDVARLTVGDGAEVTLDAKPGWPLRGTVSEIAAAADPASGTFEIEVQFDAGEQRLRSGYLARVTLKPRSLEALHYLPLDAVVALDRNQVTLYVVDADTRQARRIVAEVALLLDTEIAIRHGIGSADHVVTAGASYLRPGARVTVDASL